MAKRIVIINEYAGALDTREGRVPVRALRTGDVLSSGEKVTVLSRTTDGRTQLTLTKSGYPRSVSWSNTATVAVRDAGEGSTPKSFWSYQAPDTPSLEEAIAAGAISPRTTKGQWEQLSPGMRREIVRSKLKKGKDGVGEPEEVAYGEGWHAKYNQSPYDDPALSAAWARGRKAKERQERLRKHSARQGPLGTGMKRKVAFEPPRRSGGPVESGHIADKSSHDFKSEKGYVAKLVDATTGGVLARSEPHISNGPGLKRWIQEEAQKLIARGKRVKAEIAIVFYDPNLVNDGMTLPGGGTSKFKVGDVVCLKRAPREVYSANAGWKGVVVQQVWTPNGVSVEVMIDGQRKTFPEMALEKAR